MVDKEQYHIDILVGLAERTIKKLWVIIILLVVLLFGSNAAWIYHESQFEDTTTTIEQEVEQEAQDGTNTFVGGDLYGSAEDSLNGYDQNENP